MSAGKAPLLFYKTQRIRYSPTRQAYLCITECKRIRIVRSSSISPEAEVYETTTTCCIHVCNAAALLFPVGPFCMLGSARAHLGSEQEILLKFCVKLNLVFKRVGVVFWLVTSKLILNRKKTHWRACTLLLKYLSTDHGSFMDGVWVQFPKDFWSYDKKNCGYERLVWSLGDNLEVHSLDKEENTLHILSFEHKVLFKADTCTNKSLVDIFLKISPSKFFKII